jgi:tyrosinase
METSNIGSHGNVFLEDHQNVSADTELLPFRKTPGTFLTFNDCRNTTTLGYAYPETQRWNFASDEAYQSNVTATIATLYGGRTRSQTHFQVVTQSVTAFGQILLDNNNTYTDWIIETQAIASELAPTFIVSFSLTGMFQSDPIVDIGNWMMLMPERINDVHTQDTPSVIEKMTNGTTSITTHLIDRINAGQLDSLDPNDVVPYLSEYLTWNVYDVSLSTFMATTITDLGRNAANVFHSQTPKPLRSRYSAPPRACLTTPTHRLYTAIGPHLIRRSLKANPAVSS